MAAQVLLPSDYAARRTGGMRLFQLGWAGFWLLGAILAGLIGLAWLVLVGMFGLS